MAIAMEAMILPSDLKSILLTKKGKNCRIYQLMSEIAHGWSPEDFNRPSPLGVVFELHNKIRTAIAYQEDLLDAANRHGEPIDATNVAIYSSYEVPEIPARHYRVILGPRYRDRHDLQHGIAAMVVRIPVNTESFVAEEVVNNNSWNDVFLQVWKKDGEPQNFLLNSKGLVPFENALEDVDDDYLFGQTHDLFTVIRPTEPRFELTLEQIRDLLDDSRDNRYALHPQSNDDEPPFFEPTL